MNTDWMEQAACRGMNVNSFVLDHDPQVIRAIREAKKVCANCLVVTDCLEFALAIGEECFGVWGNTSQRERREIRSQRERGEPAPVRIRVNRTVDPKTVSGPHGSTVAFNEGCRCVLCTSASRRRKIHQRSKEKV